MNLAYISAGMLALFGAWHMLTLALAVSGVALVRRGVRQGSSCEGVGTPVASSFTGFAAIALAGPRLQGRSAAPIRHPAPGLWSAVALTTWLARGGRPADRRGGLG